MTTIGAWPILLLGLCSLCVGCRKSAPVGLPGPDRLPVHDQLPSPFEGARGGGASLECGAPRARCDRVRSRTDWPRRRAEIRRVLESYQYGRAPRSSRGRITARQLSQEQTPFATRQLLQLNLGAVQLHLGLQRPPGPGPFPVIVHIDHRGVFHEPLPEETARRGYVVASYDPTVIAPDMPGSVGPAQAAHPDQDWATLAMWAWGASRVVDYLVTLPWIDRRHLVVTGHSRSGKAALWAGALDQRFALVVPQGSGCGGVASYRFRSGDVETLERLTASFPHWFVPRLRLFASREERLPFDQHWVLALVAPRALLSIDALGDVWANPHGTQVSYLAAREVYRFLGAANRIGISMRPGVHQLSDADWRTMLDFADQVLLGRGTRRRFDALPFEFEPAAFTWRAPKS